MPHEQPEILCAPHPGRRIGSIFSAALLACGGLFIQPKQKRTPPQVDDPGLGLGAAGRTDRSFPFGPMVADALTAVSRKVIVVRQICPFRTGIPSVKQPDISYDKVLTI